MKRKLNLLAAALAFLFIYACEKDNNTPAPENTNIPWRLIGGSWYDQTKSYLSFDDNYMLYLRDLDKSLKSISYFPCTYYPEFNSIVLFGKDWYSVSVIDDTLRIVSDYPYNTMYVAVKDDNGYTYSNYTNSDVKVIESYKNYDYNSGVLAYDGKNLVMARLFQYYANGLYYLDPHGGGIVDSINIDSFNQNGYFAISDNYYYVPKTSGKIDILNISDRQLFRSVDLCSKHHYCGPICSDDQSIYYIYPMDNQMYQIDLATENCSLQFDFGSHRGFVDMEFVDGYIYGVSNEFIYKYDPVAKEIVESYKLNINEFFNYFNGTQPNNTIKSITYDGSNFWISIGYDLLKVSF